MNSESLPSFQLHCVRSFFVALCSLWPALSYLERIATISFPKTSASSSMVFDL
jgi:hypothetical protein